MRSLALALLLALLPATAGAVRHGPMYLRRGRAAPMIIETGMKTRFFAPYTASGFPLVNLTTSWPVSGVPAPTSVHTADDPTGSVGYTSGTWTAGGTPTAGVSPFNRSGDFATPSGGNAFRRYDGVNDNYVSDAAGVWSPASADFSVCLLFRDQDAAGKFMASNRESSGTGEGWRVATGASEWSFAVENHAGTAAAVAWNTANPHNGAWQLCCGTHDFDGNMTAYCNGVADPTTTASPGGVIDPTTSATVGTADSAALDFTGDIAWVLYWQGTVLSAAQVALLHEYVTGRRDSLGSTSTSSNTGPYCLTYAGALECFGDDFGPTIGAEMPPGATGAGGPASCVYIANSNTNSVVQSIDLATTWVATDGGGAAVVGTAATTPFADGRAVKSITDDQAGTVEKVCSGAMTITSMNATDPVQVTVWARDAAGTVLDAQFVEADTAGADCAGSTTNVAAKTIDTTWTRYTFSHTVQDTLCETLSLCLSPADFAAAANTGTAEVTQVGVWMANGAAGGQASAPPYDIPTATAAVTAGSDLLAYTITGRGIVNGAGALVGTVEMSMQFAPAVSVNLGSAYAYMLAKDATDYAGILWNGSAETMIAYDGTSHGVSAAYDTPGTLATVKASFNYDSDQYYIELNGTRTANTTADTSPTGITTSRIGSRTAAATAATGGFWMCSAKARH